MNKIDNKTMTAAFKELDRKSPKVFQLIMGGGSAMIAAHAYPLATSDVDALPKGLEFYEIEDLVKEIAKNQNLPTDWLNPYFSTFIYTLPHDYESRLIDIYSGAKLTVRALGKEDMLILKCFAHRTKDLGHAKALLKAGTNIKFVETHIESLAEKKYPHALLALDFLDQIKDELNL